MVEPVHGSGGSTSTSSGWTFVKVALQLSVVASSAAMSLAPSTTVIGDNRWSRRGLACRGPSSNSGRGTWLMIASAV